MRPFTGIWLRHEPQNIQQGTAEFQERGRHRTVFTSPTDSLLDILRFAARAFSISRERLPPMRVDSTSISASKVRNSSWHMGRHLLGYRAVGNGLYTGNTPPMQPNHSIKQIICIKWGVKYSADYVNRLYAMTARYTSPPFQLYCFTDNAAGHSRAKSSADDSRTRLSCSRLGPGQMEENRVVGQVASRRYRDRFVH